jgi:HK97 family phage major capsid protein
MSYVDYDKLIREANEEMRRIVRANPGDAESWPDEAINRFDHALRAEKEAKRAQRADSESARTQEQRRDWLADKRERLERSRAGLSGDLRSNALRTLEGYGNSRRMSPAHQDAVSDLIEGQGAIGVDNVEAFRKHVITTGTDVYRSAWRKAIEPPEPFGHVNPYTSAEKEALHQYLAVRIETIHRPELRALNESGTAAYAIPISITPELVPTAGGQESRLLALSRRVVAMSGDEWRGVALVNTDTTGYAWLAESTAATDESATLQQPSFPYYKAANVVPGSIEIFQDYGDSFFNELQRLLAIEYQGFMANAICNGSGSGQPDGIFTQMAATTTNPVHVTVSSKGAIDLPSVDATLDALPDRYHDNAVFVCHPTVLAKIRAAESGQSLALYGTSGAGAPLLGGRPVIETMYAPAFTGTTSNSAVYLVAGDFADMFLVATRLPSVVELIPHLFSQSTALPTGQRAVWSQVRVGFGALDPNGFRILGNT